MTKVNVRAAILYVRERTHEYQIIRHCTLSSAVQLRYGTVRYGTAQYGTVGYNTHNTVLCSTALYSTVYYCTSFWSHKSKAHATRFDNHESSNVNIWRI